MVVAVLPAVVITRSLPVPPKIDIRFRLLRDGEVTPEPKTLRVFRSWEGVNKLEMVFHADDGEWTRAQRFDLAMLLAQGDWLLAGTDATPPQRTRATYMDLSSAGVDSYDFNITSATGGGDQIATLPATIKVAISVDKTPAIRETLIVEKMADGKWRVAGYGPSDTATDLTTLSLQVTPASTTYAIALDDYGVAFAPSLSVTVGQKIRPTTMAGWVYLITEPGVLPAQEPAWWSETLKDDQPLGTARAVVQRYYAPQCHGPVPVTLTAA